MAVNYILSIDQGTTGSRAIIYDKSGRSIASNYQEFPQYFPKPGWVEHDPMEIWESVSSSIQKVLKKVPKGSIAAIGITNQRETTVIWDKASGKPIHNAIVWQCRRTAGRCEALKKRGGENFFRERTGLPIDAYFSATKIEWILNNVKGAKKKSENGKLCFGTVDSWILWQLSGGKVHATDYTNASRTMLFNIKEMKWDKEILKKLKIHESLLPEVKKSSGKFGQTVSVAGLSAGIPISGIAGDQQAALFGQACFTPGMMKNTYGTGCFILLNTGKKHLISKYGLITTIGCGSRTEPVYVLEGSVFVAGAAVQWLRDGLKLFSHAAHTEKMAASVKDNGGVYFVPALTGLGAPYWEPEARGSIFGLTRCTTKEHVARAALEAMCYQTRDVIEAMVKDSHLKIKDIKVDGGAVANNFLCQFQADILGANVIRPKVIETTSRGVAYLAGLAVGYWKNTKEIKKYWEQDRLFSPKMSAVERDELYSNWNKAVLRTLSIYPSKKT